MFKNLKSVWGFLCSQYQIDAKPDFDLPFSQQRWISHLWPNNWNKKRTERKYKDYCLGVWLQSSDSAEQEAADEWRWLRPRLHDRLQFQIGFSYSNSHAKPIWSDSRNFRLLRMADVAPNNLRARSVAFESGKVTCACLLLHCRQPVAIWTMPTPRLRPTPTINSRPRMRT